MWKSGGKGMDQTGGRHPGLRTVSVRAAIMAELERGQADALALSAAVGIAEREVAEHLEHIARSLKRQGRRLEVLPARCLECGFVFRKRERLTRPGRCPVCGGERIGAPAFSLSRTSRQRKSPAGERPDGA